MCQRPSRSTTAVNSFRMRPPLLLAIAIVPPPIAFKGFVWLFQTRMCANLAPDHESLGPIILQSATGQSGTLPPSVTLSPMD